MKIKNTKLVDTIHSRRDVYCKGKDCNEKIVNVR